MKATMEQYNRFKLRLSLKTKPTIEYYTIYVDKFIKYGGGDLSVDTVINFLKTIKINSRRTVYWTIRFFYKANEIPIGITVDEVTQKTHFNITKEALNTEEVKAFIRASKLYYGTIEMGYSAISTIYGARRGEIFNLEYGDINEDATKLRIKTLKGGEDRVHLVPEEVRKVIYNLKSGLKRVRGKPAIQAMNFLFDHICFKAGIELRPRLGFHSIRRALISEFMLLDFNPTIVRSFCRWKEKEQDIMSRYDIKNTDKVDRMIFEKHPFLGYWK